MAAWCPSKCAPALSPRAGRPIGFQGIYRDITERKRAQAALRKARDELEQRVAERTAALAQTNIALQQEITQRQRVEEALRATFEQAAVGMAQVSLEGRWLMVNQRLCDIVGYARDEILARTFQELTYPEDLAADLAAVRRVIAGEISTYSLEKRYRRKDGLLVWVNLTVSLVQAEQPYFIAVIEDITERKRAEEALRHERELLQTIIDTVPVMITLYEPDTKRLRFNPAFEQTVGWSTQRPKKQWETHSWSSAIPTRPIGSRSASSWSPVARVGWTSACARATDV